MKKLSPVQLKKLSDKQIDSLIDSLYLHHDKLKSTISNNVWIGDHGGVASGLGRQATAEIEEIRSYIMQVENIIASKKSRFEYVEHYPATSESCEDALLERGDPSVEKTKEFDSFQSASSCAKENPGSKLSRTSDGGSWKVTII